MPGAACAIAAVSPPSTNTYAATHEGDSRALLLLAPGWIRTAPGGAEAPFSLEETIPDVVNVLLSKRGQPGLAYLDRMGRTVPW